MNPGDYIFWIDRHFGHKRMCYGKAEKVTAKQVRLTDESANSHKALYARIIPIESVKFSTSDTDAAAFLAGRADRILAEYDAATEAAREARDAAFDEVLKEVTK